MVKKYVRIQVLNIEGIINDNKEDSISKTIIDLVDEIEMKRIGRISVYKNKEYRAYYQPIKESHIAAYLHRANFLFLSIVSCKKFNEQKAFNYVQRELSLSDVLINSYKI